MEIWLEGRSGTPCPSNASHNNFQGPHLSWNGIGMRKQPCKIPSKSNKYVGTWQYSQARVRQGWVQSNSKATPATFARSGLSASLIDIRSICLHSLRVHIGNSSCAVSISIFQSGVLLLGRPGHWQSKRCCLFACHRWYSLYFLLYFFCFFIIYLFVFNPC